MSASKQLSMEAQQASCCCCNQECLSINKLRQLSQKRRAKTTMFVSTATMLLLLLLLSLRKIFTLQMSFNGKPIINKSGQLKFNQLSFNNKSHD